MPSEPDPQMSLFEVDRSERSGRATYDEMLKAELPVRASDPSGSFVAAERMQKSGIGGRQRRAVYMALRQHQGSTSKELAEHMGCADRMVTARRLPELEACGWVTRGRRRKCRISGIESVTWWVKRGWIQNTDRQAPVPSERATGAAKDGPGTKAAPSGGSAAHGQAEGLPPVTGLTVAERQRLRRKLADAGNPWASQYTDAHDSAGAVPHDGEGASNHGDR